MNVIKRTACALAVLATTATAAMAQGIDIRVIGTITPPACKMSLSNGGTIDYGNIDGSTLSASKFTQLSNKQLDFGITCAAPTKIAVHAINDRPQTAAGTEERGSWGGLIPDGLNVDNGDFVVGLGLADNHKIGGYNAALTNVLGDGKEVTYLGKLDNLPVWSKLDKSYLINLAGFTDSWSNGGVNLTPSAFNSIAGKLNVQAYINKTSELDLTKPITLDGMLTMELIYL